MHWRITLSLNQKHIKLYLDFQTGSYKEACDQADQFLGKIVNEATKKILQKGWLYICLVPIEEKKLIFQLKSLGMDWPYIMESHCFNFHWCAMAVALIFQWLMLWIDTRGHS